MPTGPAARILDNVVHPLPGILMPGPGSMDVMIGNMKAWRGVLASVAAALQGPKQTSDATIQGLEASTAAAAGTPGAPAAYAAEQTGKLLELAKMSSLISSSASGADIHVCNSCDGGEAVNNGASLA